MTMKSQYWVGARRDANKCVEWKKALRVAFVTGKDTSNCLLTFSAKASGTDKRPLIKDFRLRNCMYNTKTSER